MQPLPEPRVLEQRVRHAEALFDGIDDAVFVHDLEGRILDVNPAACRRLGYSREELLRMTTRDIDDAPFATGFRQRLQEQQSRGRLSCEGCHITKDGRRIPVDINTSFIQIGGRPVVLAVMRDITERKNAEEMQRNMHTCLIRSEKLAAIGLLSAGLAHEINNPLAYVANNLVVLERDVKALRDLALLYDAARPRLAEVDPQTAEQARALAEQMDLPYVRDNLERILTRTREGVERMAKIVHGLRGLARTDRPELEETHLPDLLDATLEMVRGMIQRRGIHLELHQENVPRTRCVAAQIGQVLLNLLINAVQAVEARADHGAGRIDVSMKRVDQEVLIEVADNGCGIDAKNLPRIFDPFYTTKPVGEGTGLGLSISHGIITGHGGRIEVDSQLGAGSRFRIYLPLDSARGSP